MSALVIIESPYAGDVEANVAYARAAMRDSILPIVTANVRPGTLVHTDYLHTYRVLPELGYRHDKVNHNKGEYVNGRGSHVQTIEGFWSQLKRAINGTHVHVSGKHLWKYAKEAEYRFNRRHTPEAMLPELLSTFRPLTAKRG